MSQQNHGSAAPEKKLTDKVTATEIAAYSCVGAGNGLGQCLYNSYGTYFYTNIAGIDPLVTGTFMTVCKVIDFCTDLLMGVLVDKGTSKSGDKARPWLRRGILPFSLGIIMMFSAPFSTPNATLIWAIITFVLSTAVCYTMNMIPTQSMLPMITNDRFERSKLEVCYTILSMGIMIVAGMIVTPMVTAFGGGKRGWLLMAIVIAAVSMGLHIFGYLGTKERVHPPKPPKNMSILTELKYLFQNKYWVLMLPVTFARGLNTINVSMIYYAQYVVNNLDIMAYMMLLNMGPMCLMLVIAPFIIMKFGKRTVWVAGCIICTVSLLIMWVFRTNPTAFFIGFGLNSFGNGGINSTFMSFIGDAIDYGEYKTGVRTVGVAYSLNFSLEKVGTALQSLIFGAMLTWGGYSAELAVQPDTAITAITMAFIGLPLILSLITLVCALAMNVEKKYPNMAADLQARRAERASADTD